MPLDQYDAAVLECLTKRGPGHISVSSVCEETGLSGVRAEVSLHVLAAENRICLMQSGEDIGSGRYLVAHIHPESEGADGSFVTS